MGAARQAATSWRKGATMCPTEQPDDEPARSPGALSLDDTGEWPMLEAITQLLEREPLPRLKESTSTFQEPGESPSPAASATDSIPRMMAAIKQLGGMVEQRLSILQSLFDREHGAEAMREKIVDRLHAELQESKQDFLLTVQRPIFIDLIQLHDDIGKMLEAQPADDASRLATARGHLESIRAAILEILYRQGVEPFQTESDEFDPRRQRALTTVPTAEPGRNRTIACRLRPGFQAGEKIIRPELVSVYTVRACKRLPREELRS
jgi:molecular chaperone GrpE